MSGTPKRPARNRFCLSACEKVPYSITISNDKTGHTYEAYQIFMGQVSDDTATGGAAEGPMLGNIDWGKGVEVE